MSSMDPETKSPARAPKRAADTDFPRKDSVPQNLSAKVDLNSMCDNVLSAFRSRNLALSREALQQLRRAVLFQGVPEDVHEDINDSLDPGLRLTLRGKVWKTFLGVENVNAEEYMALIDKGTSHRYDKVRGDSFRTFPHEKAFKERVSEPSLIRLCNSFTHKYYGDASPFSYRQGMNAICAPLLFCMPEVDAFATFEKMITEKFPLYWTNDVVGGQAACKLIDQCLNAVDPELFSHLQRYGNLNAYIYAFSPTSSLSASVPPFSELLQLWDFLFAFGIHMNVLCVVAQIILLRDKLLKTQNPKALLDYRKWPPLRAKVIISVTMALLPRIPPTLYQKVCMHGTDPQVASELVGRAITFKPYKPPKFT